MKSIIEQASSVMKAIEKAWNQAEKPKEFSIKIFEHEERNFFGMSTKPAKVGIFFSDKPAFHEKPTPRPRQEIKECREPISPRLQSAGKVSNAAKPTPQPQPIKPQQPVQQRVRTPENAQPRPTSSSAKSFGEHSKPEMEIKPRRISATWNDTMIATTHHWLKQTLSLMGLPAIDFNSEVAGKNLKLTFVTPLIADPMHEKQLFRSFAHLIMSSLRNQYKQEIKDLKVVLIRPE